MVYATGKSKKDARSALGRRFDQLCGLFLIWLASFLLLASLMEKLQTAFIFSIPLLVLEAVLLRKLFFIIDRKRQLRRKFRLTGKKIFDDIAKVNSRHELKLIVLELFRRIPDFQTISLNSSEKQEIDLIGVYQGTPVAIQCACPEGNRKIKRSDIQSFAGALSLGGYKNGLLVTTGEHSPGVTRVIKQIFRRGINIKPIDRYGLVNIALRAGLESLREKDAQQGISLSAADESRTTFPVVWDSVFRFEKAKSYYLFGLMLYGGYILMRGTTFLSYFYLSFALLNIFMGTICLYLGRSIVNTDPLKGFGPDKT